MVNLFPELVKKKIYFRFEPSKRKNPIGPGLSDSAGVLEYSLDYSQCKIETVLYPTNHFSTRNHMNKKRRESCIIETLDIIFYPHFQETVP